MAEAEMELDPNAVVYSDDEIVGKVNAATVKVSADSCADGTTNKVFTATEDTKLAGIAAGAEVNPADLAALDTIASGKLAGIEASATADQTGAEIQTAVLGLADADRKLIKTDPQTGEFTVLSIQRKPTGKLGAKYDDIAV